MKRTTKTVMALLTAMTMTTGALGVTAYAEDTQQAAVETALRTEEGTFKDGAKYTYILSSGALIIGGEGSFTTAEFDALTAKHVPTVVIFGRDVKLPKSSRAANEWICSLLKLSSGFTVLTFKGSDLEIRRKEMLNALAAEAVKEGKKADAAAFSDAFYIYDIDGYIDSEEEAAERFDFSDALVEKGKEVTDMLIGKGIKEQIARQITAHYLYGLRVRINCYHAYPDGREMNDEMYDYFMEQCEHAASTQQDVIECTDEENMTFSNVVSQFLSENGFVGKETYVTTRLYALGARLNLSFSPGIVVGEIPDDLAEAKKAEYEEQYISPDLTNMDMVLEYRGKWMREYLEGYKHPSEIMEEVIGDYLTGLKLRIEEGLAQKTGEEINDDTKYEFMRICGQSCSAKTALKDGADNERSKANFEKIYSKNKKLLLSDYTKNTEDSKTKYVNADGDYVKYEIFTENDGVLESGVEYHYNPENKMIFFDGDGTLTLKDSFDLGKNFDYDIIIAGRNVSLGDDLLWVTCDEEGKDRLCMSVEKYCNNSGLFKLYTFADSKIKKIYDNNIDMHIKYAEGCSYGGDLEDGCTDRAKLEAYFPIYIMDDDADPYDILNGTNNNSSNSSTKNAVPETAQQTLKGDADENGEVSLSDIVVVSKYDLNNTAYPMKSDTALANADMNGDKIIDSRDTSALIEVNLN